MYLMITYSMPYIGPYIMMRAKSERESSHSRRYLRGKARKRWKFLLYTSKGKWSG